MRAEFAARVPTLWHGHGITHRIAGRLTADREVLTIVDSAMSTAVVPGVRGRTIMIEARAVDAAAVVMIAEELVRRPPEVIVVVGGGTILDAGKIAALVLASGRMLDFAVEHASRSAVTFLPDGPSPVDIVAVPTTLGTSSETNSVGILKNASGYRLVIGRPLRPRHAIIDSRNLMSLSSAAVREGALEAFLRIAGSSTSSRRSARSRGDAIALGRALIDTVARDHVAAGSRLRLARLSAATQRTAALTGEDPYSARHWYIANEVASVLEVRKMMATAAVVAAVWRRVCAGDARWGDRASLAEFWTGVARGFDLPLDPPAGIAALIDRWQIPVPAAPSPPMTARIAAATEEAWGDRLPMLAGLRASDFHDLVRDSSWSPQSVARPSRPPDVREEVD
ncbi:daptide-type RiPP biosynthesis dehydogenase [Microbacterium sp. NPDC089320]|uniref:daptide-type RiPP biosynthesis dehydogenase n=1 Tax=Microbacterium sp. NPDC089320 TaxID=3155182 RepID=UPI00344A6DC3